MKNVMNLLFALACVVPINLFAGSDKGAPIKAGKVKRSRAIKAEWSPLKKIKVYAQQIIKRSGQEKQNKERARAIIEIVDQMESSES